jgi:hypothetical protein
VGHTVTHYEAMVIAALGTPSPGCVSLARTVVPVQRSPGLGELMVVVDWVPRQKEDHVIAVANLPNQITVANESGRSGSAIWKNGGKAMLARSVPLPGMPTVGV